MSYDSFDLQDVRELSVPEASEITKCRLETY